MPTITGDPMRTRLLDATSVLLARYGPRKLSLSAIASVAGVSRPTLYRHFSSKKDLLVALAGHEKARFEFKLAEVLDGLTGVNRLDRALRFMVEFQNDYPMQGLVLIEPGFILDQLEQSLRTMAPTLASLFSASGLRGTASPDDRANLVVRIALSHFLVRGEDAQLLRQLRHVAGIDA